MQQGTPRQYLPRLRTLYRRHVGLTKALSGTFEEALAVCLDKIAVPPTQFDLKTADSNQQRLLR
jgi:hypothetical protein